MPRVGDDGGWCLQPFDFNGSSSSSWEGWLAACSGPCLLDRPIARAVRTDITSHSGVGVPEVAAQQESRFPRTSPQDAATVILDGMEDDKLHVLVGRDARLMNLANRVALRRSAYLIHRQMKGPFG